jgi:hypothetical protein
MIGVACRPEDLDAAREFFELFKTPWEPVVSGRKYSVLLGANGASEHLDADVVLLYSSAALRCDSQNQVSAVCLDGPLAATCGDDTFPIYGRARSFDNGPGLPTLTSQGRGLDYRFQSRLSRRWRIGYDLFGEVRYLLEKGQPTEHARTATLELHIALLRRLLLESGTRFIEIPPRPIGYDFACCLTHDIDFAGILRHRCDRTLAGFVARAAVGTLTDWLRGRRPLADVVRNWWALCILPLVFLKFLPDLWRPFDDYAEADQGLPSTFFVVPFKGRPGERPDGAVAATRAVSYQASDIAGQIRNAAADGCEVAVHGIDAWRDANAGRVEMAELTKLTGRRSAGVRMHWLYFADHSPARLEQAGFDYDSTWGYNDAVGFRAGTSQVFRLPGTRSLLELPLAIMDTALFYRDRMGLQHDEALHACLELVETTRRFGGTIVVDWHDRSLAPERLWKPPYSALLEELARNKRVWFAAAADAVAWFSWRLSISFSVDDAGRVTVSSAYCRSLPSARVYIHHPAGDSSLDEIEFSGDQPLSLTDLEVTH